MSSLRPQASGARRHPLAFNVFHPSLEFMSRNAGTLANVWRHVTTHPLPHGGCLTRADAVSYETPRRLVRSTSIRPRWDASGVLTRSTPTVSRSQSLPTSSICLRMPALKTSPSTVVSTNAHLMRCGRTRGHCTLK